MKDLGFIWQYADACARGALKLSDCGPVWQFGVMAVLLFTAIFALVVVRLHLPR